MPAIKEFTISKIKSRLSEYLIIATLYFISSLIIIINPSPNVLDFAIFLMSFLEIVMLVFIIEIGYSRSKSDLREIIQLGYNRFTYTISRILTLIFFSIAIGIVVVATILYLRAATPDFNATSTMLFGNNTLSFTLIFAEVFGYNNIYILTLVTVLYYLLIGSLAFSYANETPNYFWGVLQIIVFNISVSLILGASYIVDFLFVGFNNAPSIFYPVTFIIIMIMAIYAYSLLSVGPKID